MHPPNPSLAKRSITATALVALLAWTAVQEHAGGPGSRGGSGGGSGGGPEPGAERPGGMLFEETSRAAGIDFRHEAVDIDDLVANVEAQITATGAAVSIVDADGDGLPDLYTVTGADGGANVLYRNRGDGTFEDVAARAGLADLNHDGVGVSMGSVWADYDNDGDRDVFVYKWGRSQLLRNEGDLTFTDVSAGSGLDGWGNSHAATWIDYDRDGLLDLYVTGYFPEELDLWNLSTTKVMHDSFEFASNGGRNRLFRGNGDGTFEDVTERTIDSGRRWTYAALAADLDRDGWQDLYVANDYGSEQVFLNRGGERFEEQAGLGLNKESKSGMCAAIGDVYGTDGDLCVFVTNISKSGFLFQGNNLRVSRLHDTGEMWEVAERQVADCGWAWGAQFADLDGDGWQDLVVVNGFISASKDRDYWYQMSKVGMANQAVIEDAAQWPPFEDRSLSGYERTQVLHNQGLRGARFREVGLEVGIDDVFDGRAVAVGDLFGDGRPDVVTASQKGPLLVYRNRSENDNRWIAFELVGTASNRDALGAEVRLWRGDRVQTRVVTSFSGFSAQNEHAARFGLGPGEEPVRIRIRWPSGREQELEGLALDMLHTIVEPR